MEIGVTIFATDRAIQADRLATELEDRGFESLFLPEHTHIPSSRQTPYPAGGELPEEDWADGWMPMGGAGLTTTLPQLRQAAEDAGRDPDSIRIMVFGARPDPGLLDHYRQLGVTRTVLLLPPAGADVVLPLLDDCAKLL